MGGAAWVSTGGRLLAHAACPWRLTCNAARNRIRTSTSRSAAGEAGSPFHLRMREPIPLMWGVILGEAIHDLRSALDHVVIN